MTARQLAHILKALIDAGANGGIAGRDMKFFSYPTPARYANIRGIGNHQMNEMRIGTFIGKDFMSI